MCSQLHTMKAPVWQDIPCPLHDFRHTQLQRKMTYKIMVMPWALRGQSRLKAKCCGVHAGPICSKQGLFSTAKKQTSVPACPQTQRSVLVYHRLAEQISHPCSFHSWQWFLISQKICALDDYAYFSQGVIHTVHLLVQSCVISVFLFITAQRFSA